MPRIPRSFARRARSTASSFLGTPSGSECACISIAPLRVCAFADSEKTRNIAANCDLMDGPFIEQVSLEPCGRPDPKQPLAPSAMSQLYYCTTRRHVTSRCEHDGNGEDKHNGNKLLERLGATIPPRRKPRHFRLHRPDGRDASRHM